MNLKQPDQAKVNVDFVKNLFCFFGKPVMVWKKLLNCFPKFD
jgi:hypothetical protein